MRIMLKSKIHKATVTKADIKYMGSITIDQELLNKVDLWSGEQVLVVDNTNGHRLWTYVISGQKNKGEICMNGAAAHLIKPGDEIIIMAFALSTKKIKPRNILVDHKNKFVKFFK
ncbi:aspartate 1-decarboxylase [Candidatus Woesearchaeota archaeon]|nr:aspartate 1-decarboxylase [Candidatus Woesearchaeota archaeon]